MSRTPARRPVACIVPPDLLRAARGEGAGRTVADGLDLDAAFRAARAAHAAGTTRGVVGAGESTGASATAGTPRRSIYDQKNSTETTPGTLARAEGQDPVADVSVNQAYDGFGDVYRFFWETLQRDSIDGQGMAINGLVHYGTAYDNAFWDGAGNMFFGDGDGKMFLDFTKGLDVIGHELTHGVTQYTANLTYEGQSGALNESVSDVFGSLVKQFVLGQTAEAADWLIGPDIVGPDLQVALRSMKAPGTANQYDKQPADMDAYDTTTDDNGGVHTNSGIPNHAFYLAATAIGGNAWEKAGRIWYAALTDPAVTPDAQFRDFADATVRAATAAFADSVEAVTQAWQTVKVI